MTITTEFQRLLIRIDQEHPDAVASIQQQQTVSSEIERLRLAMAEAEAPKVVYHLTAH